MLTLNIAGGKMFPLKTIYDDDEEINPVYTLNIDTSYYSETKPISIETDVFNWSNNQNRTSKQAFCNIDIFEFMERTILQFDHITIYRFLEHISFTQLNYFIYLVSTITRRDSMVDVIVPNYEVLAQKILEEETRFEKNDYDKYDSFEGWNIELTTELLNEPSCPHASIWTPLRAKMFWELEKRFEVVNIDKKFNFDGRNIYLRFYVKRI